MGNRTNTPSSDTPTKTVRVHIAATSHYDQWCAGDYVFDRDADALEIPKREATKLVAASAGNLVTEPEE